jgi:hypothetical protein
MPDEFRNSIRASLDSLDLSLTGFNGLGLTLTCTDNKIDGPIPARIQNFLTQSVAMSWTWCNMQLVQVTKINDWILKIQRMQEAGPDSLEENL